MPPVVTNVILGSDRLEAVAMGFAVKEVQSTPNPNAMKFVLDARVSGEPASFYSRAQAAGHPLAEKLLAIEGVSNIMLLNDFVTVGKQPHARWSDINGRVKQILAAV